MALDLTNFWKSAGCLCPSCSAKRLEERGKEQSTYEKLIDATAAEMANALKRQTAAFEPRPWQPDPILAPYLSREQLEWRITDILVTIADHPGRYPDSVRTTLDNFDLAFGYSISESRSRYTMAHAKTPGAPSANFDGREPADRAARFFTDVLLNTLPSRNQYEPPIFPTIPSAPPSAERTEPAKPVSANGNLMCWIGKNGNIMYLDDEGKTRSYSTTVLATGSSAPDLYDLICDTTKRDMRNRKIAEHSAQRAAVDLTSTAKSEAASTALDAAMSKPIAAERTMRAQVLNRLED